MNRSQRSSLAVGVILVLLGVYFILANMVPQFNQWLNISYSWPTIILAVGAGLLVLGLIVGAPDMAVPAVIVGGFSGIGMILAHVLGARDRYSLGSALDTIGTSLVMFIIFGAFFGAFKAFGDYWPLLLVGAGVLIGLRTLLRPRK